MTVYAIMGRYWDTDKETWHKWLLPLAFYDREQAQAHIQETMEEIGRIWVSTTAETGVEWQDGKWRKYELGPSDDDFDWQDTKLPNLDETLVNQFMVEPDTHYFICELQMISPT